MKVYKFGGASIKDVNGVKNLKNVLESIGYQNVVLVVSAMGKMTNAFEKIVYSYFYKKNDLQQNIDFVIKFHHHIIDGLFTENKNTALKEIQIYFDEMDAFIKNNNTANFDYIYDQIVSKAELISSKICSHYLNLCNINNEWKDARKCLKTNSNYRRARIDWNKTTQQVKTQINKIKLTITQGFIASEASGNTTTLGREGSDYTAAIFAHCLDAENVTIFKDVAGILNADPKEFKDTVLLHQISYNEAIEMAFYGATVIHPKTLQPLQRKEIPLFVKPFNNPLEKGTAIGKGVILNPKTPCFIVKKNQILLSISDKEFHFVLEDNISEIFNYLHKYKIKVNLIQNTAISFTVCIEDSFNNFNELIEQLQKKYKILYNQNCLLYTVRHFTKKSIKDLVLNEKILIQQSSRETTQIVVKE